jgi:hypothetical protein
VLGVEFAAQPAGVGVQGAGAAGAAEAPDVPQEFVLGEDAGGVAGEDAEEAEFLLRQVDLAVADGDAAADRVDGQVADADGALAAAGAAAQDRADPGAEGSVSDCFWL